MSREASNDSSESLPYILKHQSRKFKLVCRLHEVADRISSLDINDTEATALERHLDGLVGDIPAAGEEPPYYEYLTGNETMSGETQNVLLSKGESRRLSIASSDQLCRGSHCGPLNDSTSSDTIADLNNLVDELRMRLEESKVMINQIGYI